MEQKPLKRNKHMLQLSKDHHFTLLFCWKLRQGLKIGVEVERIQNYVKHFWLHDMQAHFRDEEDILFASVQDVKVQKAIEDHKQIKEQVDAVLQAANSIETSKQLSILADTVDAHVRYEERVLFPHLEQILTTEQLEFIGKQLKQEQALPDDYKDTFWINEK
jgi:iron-sulfur cluster repair protein YtfE (RIC family)